MKTLLFLSVSLGCSVPATGCLSTASVTFVSMDPQDRTFSPQEQSTLVVAYPRKIATFDGEEIEEVVVFKSRMIGSPFIRFCGVECANKPDSSRTSVFLHTQRAKCPTKSIQRAF